MNKSVYLIGLIVILSSVVAFNLSKHSVIKESWRYKITVVINTPDGIKRGSAVREVRVKLEPRPSYRDKDYHVKISLSGEAAIVDLGEKGIIFATLDSDDYRYVFEAFPGPPGLTPEGVRFYGSLRNKKTTLEPGPLRDPNLVTFKDINIPSTVQIVPYRLEELFGEGIHLKEITIETTNEPVTSAIASKLKWLPDYYNQMLDGKSFQSIRAANPVANSMSAGNFSTEKNNQ